MGFDLSCHERAALIRSVVCKLHIDAEIAPAEQSDDLLK
jgi:hypothetical protein